MTRIDITFEAASRKFFDRRSVIKALGQGKVDALRKVGNYVRKTSRNSIRKPGTTKKTRISSPGQPPRYHNKVLKNKIVAYYEENPSRVVIGPIRWKSPKSKAKPIGMPASGILEHGGRVRVKVEIQSSFRGRYVWKPTGKTRIVTIQPRPYMNPALQKTIRQGVMQEHMKLLMKPRYAT